MGYFIRGKQDRTIYFFNIHIIPPNTGGEIYDYEVGKYFAKIGYNVRFVEEKDVFQLRKRGLLDSIHLILKMGNIANKTFIVVDIRSHKSLVFFCLFLRLFTNAKLVTIVHQLFVPFKSIIYKMTGSPKYSLLNSVIDRFFEWFFLKIMHKIVVNSKFTKEQILSLGIDKNIKVINPAINFSKRRKVKRKLSNIINILFVGGLAKNKGIDILLKALGEIDKSYKRWQLRVVGNFDINDEYVMDCFSLVSKYGITENVVFLGRFDREDLFKEYENADIFVLPSLYEGYGMVIKEAASYGLPIISTSVGAISELVEDGKSAILVEPGDIYGLKDALVKLINDKELRDRLGRNALKTVDFDYNWDKVGKMFENFLNESVVR